MNSTAVGVERGVSADVHCGFAHNSHGVETTQCLLTSEWVKKMCYIQTTGYNSALPKKIIPCEKIQVKIEGINPSV